QLTATVAVPVIGNTRLQPDRQLALRLSNPRIDGGASTPLAFAAPQSFATATRTFASAAADFNGDGKPDLAVITQSNNSVVVLLNTTPTGAAAASFAPGQSFSVGSLPQAIAVGDVNGDGKPDLAVANTYSDTVSVLLNTTPAGASAPSFAPQQAV